MNKQQRPEWAEAWFRKIKNQSRFDVRPIPLASSREWKNSWGAIRHNSGLFFKVVGTYWKDMAGKQQERPLIEQREIGTLGFLMYRAKKYNWILVQAKVEPGNVGVCQIGPTYQATASNAARVHGGRAPAYKNFFGNNGQQVLFQILQSEQGSRFLGKLNRNMIVLAKRKVPATPFHKWVSVDDMLVNLDKNHFINTDSRSVLVCAPWDKLVGRQPFSEKKDPFGITLDRSYRTVNSRKIARINKELNQTRDTISEPKIVDLNKLIDWKLTKYGITSRAASPFRVKQISVTAHGREVEHWDQPIIESKTQGQVFLFCAKIRGVLYFNFIARAEVGLVHQVELSPSITVEPGSRRTGPAPKNYQTLIKVKQSDEGGRFFKDVSDYRIILLPDHKLTRRPKSYWLSLGEISELLKYEGVFTNEARSVLSLLLKWL